MFLRCFNKQKKERKTYRSRQINIALSILNSLVFISHHYFAVDEGNDVTSERNHQTAYKESKNA